MVSARNAASSPGRIDLNQMAEVALPTPLKCRA